MSLADFWVHSLLTQTPSPVPSCSSEDSTHENALDYALRFAQLQAMWQHPSILQHFLSLCQTQNVINNYTEIPPMDCIPKPDPSLPRPIPLKESKFLHNNLSLSPPILSRKRCGESRESRESREKECEPLKKKMMKKLEKDDKVTSSPVSGMFIKEESDLPSPEELQKEADQLDETAAFVNVSDESRRQISEIPNVIGDCVCSLCKVKYDDVFKLAQHKCPRIAHEEYKCPECEKIFSCPANLASHRRWHRPRDSVDTISCTNCAQPFPTKKALRQHQGICQSSSLTTSLTDTQMNLFSAFMPQISLEPMQAC